MHRKLARDEQGGALVEFAFAMPVLVTLIVGILQYAIVMHTTSGMRNALGEALRYAKVYPTATETEVLDIARGRFKGIDATKITALSLERGTQNGAEYGKVTMRYRLEPVVPFAIVPVINLEESRTAYLPAV